MEPAQRINDHSAFRKRSRADESIGLNYKRRRKEASSSYWRHESQVTDYSDPFSTRNMVKELDSGKYGSVSKEIEELVMRRRKLLESIYARDPELLYPAIDLENFVKLDIVEPTSPEIIELHDDQHEYGAIVPFIAQSQPDNSVIVIDSDDDGDDTRNQNHVSCLVQDVNLKKPSGNFLMKDFMEQNFGREKRSSALKKLEKDEDEDVHDGSNITQAKPNFGRDKHSSGLNSKVTIGNKSTDSVETNEPEIKKDEDMHDGSDVTQTDDETGELSDHSDGLGDIWNSMSLALEISKDPTENVLLNEYNDEEEDCEHSFIMKDDIGDVCRICGVIKRGIETIIEYNFSKITRSTRTYRSEGRSTRELDQTETTIDGIVSSSSIDFTAAEIYPHPRHRKEMKPHQIEGFNFLLSNLVCDDPGGCIMAHAPGSGKTFMIISFLQSFMAKYPSARPLVVLPRGILPVWKKEFLRWQVEDLPLYDFYSVKADSRVQQLKVLKDWAEERSILFLGYKQFSSIVCDNDNSQAAVACQHHLLKVPAILILDEGHNPRNPETNMLTSLSRVETVRKVVLSGTLYQNHVEEVFNILKLVRPKFLKMETSKSIKRRILSKVEISGRRNNLKSGSREKDFYELIEHTLIKDENYNRKITVIQDLREMTRNVLHYYKGDNLDELPGLVDFSVFLQLSKRQKSAIKELKASQSQKFSVNAQGSAIYVHPSLKALAKNSEAKNRADEEKIDALMSNMDVREGVKLSFYLNLLQLCESSGEKLLVFSQYLLPLKFLERVTAKVKGYAAGRETFMITGDLDNDSREDVMEKFNTSAEARVLFGSIKACGEGISLVGASRIIILDIHLNPSVTRQAIGRAFRPGQVKKVYVYRLIGDGSPEVEDHATCFKKESIAKMWFEWDGCKSRQSLEMEKVDVGSCGDMFMESSSRLNEDVLSLFFR